MKFARSKKPGLVFAWWTSYLHAYALNDLFKIYGIAIDVVDFRVYSRWGEMIFQTTDPKQGWDGTFLGMNSSTDVYVYEARIKMLSGKKYLLKGDLTLIR